MIPMCESKWGLSGGEWTFIDRQLQHPFEEIAEHEVERFRAVYDEHEWPYEVIQPDGTREVSDS